MLLSRMKNSLIFVVDKNPIHRNMVRFYLESKKWSNVESFPSGEECLYRLKRAPHPDFIITSFFTGNHSGFDLLKNIHHMAASARVVFFDTFEDHNLPEKLLEAGACDCILKTQTPEAGISELLKNIDFLAREKALFNVQ